MDILLKSLLRLSNLDGDYEVYPGHDEVTSLDRERATNYYMRYARGEYKPK
jgi:glyoxylase-like metal-dependent hydrolase (beta-lactamase superfamily II)